MKISLQKHVNKSKMRCILFLLKQVPVITLSMANYPSFDPDSRHTFRGKKIKILLIYDFIEPSTTIKPSSYACSKHNVINNSTVIDTAPGVIKLDNKEIKG